MMFDENGERHRRRSWDGWKIAPLAIAPALALLGWGVSVENRINTMSSIQLERTALLSKMSGTLDEINILAHDPSTKPETKREMAQIWADHDKMANRVERLEERFNNFHQFLLQSRPQNFPLGRRGEVPFRLDDRG